MSKILVLGDTHGRTIWNEIIDKEVPDRIIFLGDYVTTHEGISATEQLNNLEDILSFKEINPDKTILLRGNHDTQCLGYYWAECYPNEPDVQKVMSVDPLRSRFEKLTQWVYIDEDLRVLFSHAGVSKVWMKNSNVESIHDINKLGFSELFGFTPDNLYDQSGYSVTQPPTWIRPASLLECNVDEYDQVVGHTPFRGVTKEIAPNGRAVWFCDTQGENKYLVIDNVKFQPKTFEQ